MEHTQESIDQAFARLEELLSDLELMQEKDLKLARAREARELSALVGQEAMLGEEIQRYEHIVGEATQDAQRGADAGDKAKESKALGVLRMYSELYALRLAPHQRAKNALKLALEQTALSLDDDLLSIALSDEEFVSLEKEISDYRAEYLSCYEFCKSFDSV